MMNRWLGVGKASEPIISELGNGVMVANFTLQCVESYTDKHGAKKETVEYIAVAAWRAQAAFVSESIHKNDIVAVSGKLRTRALQPGSGSSKSLVEVLADNVTLVSSLRPHPPTIESSGH